MLTLLGYAIQLISLLVVILPKAVLEKASRITVTTRLRVTTFAVRVLLGIAIIWTAPSTKFPLVVLTVGVLIVVFGIAKLLMSNSTLESLRDRVLRHGPNAIRAIGVAGLLLGDFLTYVA
jgi:hypothetical protein